MEKNIGFLGLGKMGLPMARHLKEKGHNVQGFDPSSERRATAAASAIVIAQNAERLVIESQVIVSSLPDDAALEATARLIAANAKPGTIYIDTSTVSIDSSARTFALLQAADITYLRSTVSGNNVMAEAGQLTVMVSGDRAAYDESSSIFSCWGPTCFYLGGEEQARLMKLVVNLMIMMTSGMLAEALTLGRKGGLAWEDMWKVIASSAVASPIVKAKSVMLGKRDFSPTFTVEQMRKDVGLILNAGSSLNVPLGLTALAAQWLSSAAAQGASGEDYASVIKIVEQAAALDSNVV